MGRLMRHVFLFSVVLFSTTPTASSSIGRVIASGFLENGLSTKTFEYVAGPGEANAITLSRDYDAQAWVITDPGATITAGRGCRSLWSHRIMCRWADEHNWRVAARDRADRIQIISFCQVSCEFRVYGGRGNDVIRNRGGTYYALFRGGPGNDSIFGGMNSQHIYGESGKDQLHGGLGEDQLRGGPGNDMLWGGSGRDLMAGNNDDDRFDSRDRLRDSVLGGLGTDSALVDEGIDRVQSVETVEGFRFLWDRSRG